ncbi:hypothetical protein EIP91_000587 [Steccherinum ochraceum]|uniref:IMD domain-containing protein n=1 Tax=Steccherinum ochraceum TaxID=92696 RepID=A0A4R0RW60_9APHY|nr:hypothetical protein EIP91_000587 [Steccherinum ochraceum]
MSTSLAIADRADIHKSCKSVELLVNVLNDYCQVADALVALQKKLVKALRDSAASKVTASIPASALLTTATIFEALSEVDSKFVKLADKECDSVSNEVRKWFKKLAKEEKAHDDKVANANAKIKHAGQLYEKKAKKSPRDAQEEHARYLTLLSVLGPEVSQDRYEHSLSVTKRHTSILHNVAASVSRVADAEWLRSCEQVRRFAPAIGQLGEWRSLCEGGWTGPVPPDLPLYEKSDEAPQGQTLEKPAPEYTSRGPSEQDIAQQQAEQTPGKSSAVTSPPPQYSSPDLRAAPNETPPQSDRTRPDTTLASLASFPTPPNHFPLPPVAGAVSTPPQTPPLRSLASDSDHRLGIAESRASDSSSGHPAPRRSAPPSPALSNVPPLMTTSSDTPALTAPSLSSSNTFSEQSSPNSSGGVDRDRPPEPAPRVLQDTSPLSESPNPSVRHTEVRSREGPNDQEFGIVRSPRDDGATSAHHRSRPIERTDTGRSNGSVVAALRDRYARSPGSNSTSPKEVVRLPLSVSSLATRYDTTGEPPTSPKSPERRRLSTDQSYRVPVPASSNGTQLPVNTGPTSSPTASANEPFVVRQRAFEAEGQRLSDRERQLRQREQDIERRTKELEYERYRMQREVERPPVDLPTGDYLARSPITPSRLPDGYISGAHRPIHQHQSYSATNLTAPSMPTTPTQYMTRTSPLNSPGGPGSHAPSCGCESCSASKYGSRTAFPSARDLRPPEPPITLRPEKPKGWIRRLSMPVMGNAFSSDSKKGISNLVGSGVSSGQYRSSLALPDEDGRLRYELNGSGNRSTATLGR